MCLTKLKRAVCWAENLTAIIFIGVPIKLSAPITYDSYYNYWLSRALPHAVSIKVIPYKTRLHSLFFYLQLFRDPCNPSSWQKLDSENTQRCNYWTVQPLDTSLLYKDTAALVYLKTSLTQLASIAHMQEGWLNSLNL